MMASMVSDYMQERTRIPWLHHKHTLSASGFFFSSRFLLILATNKLKTIQISRTTSFWTVLLLRNSAHGCWGITHDFFYSENIKKPFTIQLDRRRRPVGQQSLKRTFGSMETIHPQIYRLPLVVIWLFSQNTSV